MSEVVEVEYEIPDGTVDAGYVLLYQFIDEDGEMFYGIEASEDFTFLSTLGLIEACKLKYADHMKAQDEGE